MTIKRDKFAAQTALGNKMPRETSATVSSGTNLPLLPITLHPRIPPNFLQCPTNGGWWCRFKPVTVYRDPSPLLETVTQCCHSGPLL